MSMDQLHRRDIFRILGAALATEGLEAQHHTETRASGAPKNYRPRFLSDAEYQIVTELCELLIPADEESPGAREAGVPWYVDTLLLYSDAGLQQRWKQGLAAVDQLSVDKCGKGFLAGSPQQRLAVMEVLAAHEGKPQSSIEHFFAEFKPTVIQAFSVSEVGMKEYFHYRGNTELTDFVGWRPADIES